MTYQRLLFGLFVLLIPRDLFAQDLSKATCGSNGNHTSNSAYGANLNTTLSSLSTDIGNNGFYNASTGQGPDRANAAALCRGDAQLDTCRECVQNGVSRLGDLCPVQKEAVFWDEFCTLRYSNATVYGTMESRPVYYLMNTQNVMNPDQFRADLRMLLDDLRRRAAGGSSTRKVAAGNAGGSWEGLLRNIAEVVEACPVKKEAIVWSELCFLRYSNETIYGTLETNPGYFVRNTPNVPMSATEREAENSSVENWRRRQS